MYVRVSVRHKPSLLAKVPRLSQAEIDGARPKARWRADQRSLFFCRLRRPARGRPGQKFTTSIVQYSLPKEETDRGKCIIVGINRRAIRFHHAANYASIHQSARVVWSFINRSGVSCLLNLAEQYCVDPIKFRILIIRPF